MMKIRRARIATVVALSLVLAPGTRAWAVVAGPDFPICTAPGQPRNPAIWGNVVVWTDYRNVGAGADGDIYGYDLARGAEFPICTATGEQAFPRLSGNIVVWADWRNWAESGIDIYGYDLATGREFAICCAPDNQYDPAIAANIVVWQDDRNRAGTHHSDLYGYDLALGREFPVCTEPSHQREPRVSGNLIVWADWRNYAVSDVDIYSYDLAAGREFPICTAPRGQVAPDVCPDAVVWRDVRDPGSSGDVYAYDVATRQEFPICTGPASAGGPAISGSIIVWADRRNGNGDIYGYDLATEQEFPVCTGPGDQSGPSVSGNVVVWEDKVDWPPHVDGSILEDVPPIPPPPPPQPSPQVLLRVNLHSHTDISDGSASPWESVSQARNIGLDGVALTDHGEHINNDEWLELRSAVRQASDAGFVALRGFEWTRGRIPSSAYQHINVLSPQTWCGTDHWGNGSPAEVETRMSGFYGWLFLHEDSRQVDPDSGVALPVVAQFNHPWVGLCPPTMFFEGWRWNPADRYINLIEVGKNSILEEGIAAYEAALRRRGPRSGGWHLAPTIGRDTHASWDIDARRACSGVWADAATPDSLLAALGRRRVFAADNRGGPDLKIDILNASGQPVMGQQGLPPGTTYYIDYDGPPGLLVLRSHHEDWTDARSVSGPTIEPLNVPDHPYALAEEAWYYVRVWSDNQLVLVSAPIWISLPPDRLKFALQCPADLVVTGPDGNVLSKQSAGIPGGTYEEADIDGDGDVEDWVEIAQPSAGNYAVAVVPEPGASDEDTYTLRVGGTGGVFDLAVNVPIRAAPQDGYSVDHTGLPHSPVIHHEAISAADEGQPIPVWSQVSGPASVAQARLCHRGVGQDAFSVVEMSGAFTDVPHVLVATIPAEAARAPGVEYYLEVTDDVGRHATHPAFEPETHPHLISIRPTTATLTSPALTANTWYFFSLPVEPEEASPPSILSPLGDPRTDWLLFDRLGHAYQLYPDADVRDFTLGRGYWLKVKKTGGTIDVEGRPADPSEPFEIDLPDGWSIIGCPFMAAVPWDDDHVQVTVSGQTLPLTQAVIEGWLHPTIYGYADGGRFGIDLTTDTGSLEPWQGYEIHTRMPCTLTMTANAAATRETSSAPARKPSADDWQVPLTASVNGLIDRCTKIGIKAGELAGADVTTDGVPLAEPHPPAGLGIDLFVNAASALSDDSPGLARALRNEPLTQATWDIAVATSQADAPVTVAWPDLAEMPKALVAYLIDTASGKRTYMRTRANYTYNSGESGGTRQLRVEVKQRGEGTLLISGLTAAPTRGGTWDIGFNLSADAAVTARIYNVAGRRIADIAQAQQLSRGRASLVWDSRSIANTHVPSGVYLLRVTARTEEGEQASAVTLLQVWR